MFAPSTSPAPADASALDTGALTRRILVAVTALLLLGAGVLTTLLVAAARGQDAVAEAASHRALEAALSTLQRRVVGIVSDTAYWDEAVDNVHVTYNQEWADAYLDPKYLEAMELDGVYVFTPTNDILHAATLDGSVTVGASDPAVVRLVEASRRITEGRPAAVGYLLLDGVPHVVASSRIRYIDDSRSPKPADSSVLLVTRQLDDDGLQALRRDHALPPLWFDSGRLVLGDEPRLALTAFGGSDVIGELAWQPDRPGGAMLRGAMLPVGAAAGLMLALLAVIARNASRAGATMDAGAAALQSARDMLEQKVVERTAALQRAEARLRGIFENSAEGIFQLGDDGVYLGVNPAMASIFGYASVEEFLAEAPDHTRADPDKRREFLHIMRTFGRVSDFVSPGRRRDGAPIWITQNARLVPNPDGTHYYEGMLTDITHRKRIEERLVHDALHDALTGLPNRKLFEERLTQAWTRARSSGSRPAVLLIDCDRFKLINDSLGHAAGDELLIVLAQRLSLCLRETDTISRLGGDEFAVLTEDHGESCLRLAGRFHEACRRPVVLRDRDVVVSLSIGAAVFDQDIGEASDLVRNADIAMYQAKARGRGTAVLFTSDMHADVLNRLRTESELRKALVNDELRVVYQPIIEFETGRVAGFEALVRWQHPERGLITPDEFIPIAEESSMIQALGEVVLRKATADMAAWLRRAPRSESLFVTVNLSPLQLAVDDLVERIAEILDESGLAPHRLKLEITESAMMSNPVEIRAKLVALAELDIQLCIDDFGTGYSSLSQLYSYPFHTLKIDRSFIAKLTSSADGVAVVRSILMLADTMRLNVVAEGVEEAAQYEWLRAQGCTFGQGYLFARPLQADAAEALLHGPDELRAIA